MAIPRVRRSFCSAALFLLPAMAIAVAADSAALGVARVSAKPASGEITIHRVELVNGILNRWEGVAVEAGAHSPAWREMFATQLAAMDMSTLSSLDRVRAEGSNFMASYGRFAQAIRGAQMQSFELNGYGKGNAKLGSATTDQLFVAIVPCRIVDTRNVDGPIAAGTARNYFFYSTGATDDWGGQGGIAGPSGTTCPGTVLPNGAIFAPSAAILTITVVSPTAAGNYVLWGGANPIPLVSALNWTGPGAPLANTTVVPGGGRSGGSGAGGAVRDFAVYYNGPSGSAHFVADIVGYLVENQATALDCQGTPVATLSLADGGTANGAAGVASVACPVGWALTGGTCNVDYARRDTSFARVPLTSAYYVGSFPGAQWSCTYSFLGDDVFNAPFPMVLQAQARCCRLPGR